MSKKLPITVSLEAYNPFIPGNPDDSGFPAAILRYTVKNKTADTVETTIAWSIFNPISNFHEPEKRSNLRGWGLGHNVNQGRNEGDVGGLFLFCPTCSADDVCFGSLALTTPEPDILLMPYFRRTRGLAVFWDAFSKTGSFPRREHGQTNEDELSAGAVGVRLTLKPRETKAATFYLTWYFPNFQKYWGKPEEGECCSTAGHGSGTRPCWKNYYAAQFSDAFDVAVRLHARESELYWHTKRFHDALFSSTLPPYVLDAISSQIAILKTPTVLRLSDGTFYGFEGCSPTKGCCEGSCTHVWNYAQALPFLFPSLERSMRETDYTQNIREEGSMCFRLQLPLGSKPTEYYPCVDGQLGGIIKTFRDWKICGCDDWLKRLWPSLTRALEFAWVEWDPDTDGVITGRQHNTYDIELYGANPLSACFYLGALSAGAEMAEHLGENEKAEKYRMLLQKGSSWIEQHLFNGEYYFQDCDAQDSHPYQFGSGCLSDALVGQWLARIAGLGPVLDKTRIRKTLKAIIKYNWRPSMKDHACAQHTIVCALNDESGLLVCTWPYSERPAVPLRYHDEVWAGIEYQVASHCIMEGLVDEGLRIAKAVRERHDGFKRNPWDQYECCGGHHYSRVMSSYGLLIALSGFVFDAGKAMIGFDPKIHAENFTTFWSLDGAWGLYRQTRRKSEIRVLWGNLRLARLVLPSLPNCSLRIRIGRETFATRSDSKGYIRLPETRIIEEGGRISVLH
jgi:uncharacterized protein (DUF608 family)